MWLLEFLLVVTAGYIVLAALLFCVYSALYGVSAAEVRAAREHTAALRPGQPPLSLDEEIKAAGAYIKTVRQGKTQSLPMRHEPEGGIVSNDT